MNTNDQTTPASKSEQCALTQAALDILGIPNIDDPREADLKQALRAMFRAGQDAGAKAKGEHLAEAFAKLSLEYAEHAHAQKAEQAPGYLNSTGRADAYRNASELATRLG